MKEGDLEGAVSVAMIRVVPTEAQLDLVGFVGRSARWHSWLM